MSIEISHLSKFSNLLDNVVQPNKLIHPIVDPIANSDLNAAKQQFINVVAKPKPITVTTSHKEYTSVATQTPPPPPPPSAPVKDVISQPSTTNLPTSNNIFINHPASLAILGAATAYEYLNNDSDSAKTTTEAVVNIANNTATAKLTVDTATFALSQGKIKSLDTVIANNPAFQKGVVKTGGLIAGIATSLYAANTAVGTTILSYATGVPIIGAAAATLPVALVPVATAGVIAAACYGIYKLGEYAVNAWQDSNAEKELAIKEEKHIKMLAEKQQEKIKQFEASLRTARHTIPTVTTVETSTIQVTTPVTQVATVPQIETVTPVANTLTDDEVEAAEQRRISGLQVQVWQPAPCQIYQNPITPAVSIAPTLISTLKMTESEYKHTFSREIEAREAMEAKRKAAEQAAKIAAEKARLAEVARLAAEAEKAQLPRCNFTLLTGNIKCSMS